MTYSFREANESDIPEILALFQRAYGRHLDESFYRWRFFENPFGPPMIELALDENGSIVAHYAVCAARSVLAGEEIRSAQSMTTMTDPAHERRGLFVQLAERLMARIHRQFGVQVVFGFPNRESHFGFVNRLGWQDIFALFPVERTVAPGEGGEAWQERSLQGLAFSSPVNHRPYARGEDFFMWRYARCPRSTYRCLQYQTDAGWVILKTWMDGGARVADLVELELAAGADGGAALQGLLALLAREGVQKVVGWCSLNHPNFPLLERAGFAPGGMITYFGARFLGAAPPASWGDPRLWSVSMGDSDVF